MEKAKFREEDLMAAVIVKALILLLGCSVVWALSRAVKHGRAVRKEGAIADIRLHKAYIRKAYALTIVLIAVIEITLRLIPLPQGYPGRWLFAFHIALAIVFLGTFTTLRFWTTGVQHPRLHRKMAYWCLSAGVAAASTGAWILLWI